MSFKEFFFTRIWVGQNLTEKGKQELENGSFFARHKKLFAIAFPASLIWLAYFITIGGFGAKILKTENNFDVWTEKFCIVNKTAVH